MVTVAEPQIRKMSIEEFLALPEDGVDRWLMKGS